MGNIFSENWTKNQMLSKTFPENKTVLQILIRKIGWFKVDIERNNFHWYVNRLKNASVNI